MLASFAVAVAPRNPPEQASGKPSSMSSKRSSLKSTDCTCQGPVTSPPQAEKPPSPPSEEPRHDTPAPAASVAIPTSTAILLNLSKPVTHSSITRDIRMRYLSVQLDPVAHSSMMNSSTQN